MKRTIAAVVVALMLSVGAGSLGTEVHAQQMGYVNVWGCVEYFFGYFSRYEVVYSIDDPSETSWLHWPYSFWCTYIMTCDTWHNPETGYYETYCN